LKPIKMLLTRAGIHARLKIGSSELAIGWWAVGFLGFLLLNGYISDAPKEVMYAVPALLLAAVSPVLVRNVQRPSVYPLLAVIMIIFATASFGWNTLRSVQRAATVDPRAAVLRQSQIEMAAALSKLPERIVWQSYTIYDWGIPVSVLTYYKYGEFRGADNTLFHNAKSYWDARYPALSLAELQERLYTQTKERIDVAIVLKDPEKKPEGMEEYSYSIAAYISERVQSDDKWRYHSKLRGEPFGSELAIYVNTDRRDSQALGESVQR